MRSCNAELQQIIALREAVSREIAKNALLFPFR